MRRAPIVITATVLGTAGVLLFKPLAPSSITGTTSAAGAGDSTSTSSDTSSTSSSSTGSASTPTTSSSSGAAKTTSTKTATGAVESDRYGNTQVRVTITNGKITAVTVLAYNDTDPRSAQISQGAIPVLRQEVLSKQTAAVSTVSGATYTSNAYEASLQSALDKAGFTAANGSKATTDLATADANLGGH